MIKISTSVLDILRLRLTYNNTVVKLTPTETRLLAILGEHPDTWVSRTLVTRFVWENECLEELQASERLQTLVARLRRKIKDCDIPLIIKSSRKDGLMIAVTKRAED